MEKLGSDVTFVLYKSAGHNHRWGAGSIYEHMSNFLTKFETEPPPTVITATSEWPEVGQWGFKCYNSESVEIRGMDQADCREKANILGHRYYQYFASEKICATAATCEDGMRFSNGWKAFWRPQGPQGPTPTPTSPAITPEPTPATPPPPKPTPPPPTPAPATSETCTASTDNKVWNHLRCQERCGNVDDCGSSQFMCAKFCSDCPCAATEEDEEEETTEFCTASTDNTHWNDARCQDRCGNLDDCASSQFMCAKFCSDCPCAATEEE